MVAQLRAKRRAARKKRRARAYARDLKHLQIELVKLQRWVQTEDRRLAILFEGRDAAGKGGTIRRFIEHLNPRAMRVVALPKPTSDETGQWYFQRYMQHLPNRGGDHPVRSILVQTAPSSSRSTASARRSSTSASCARCRNSRTC